MAGVEGIVTDVKSSRFIPQDKIVFMKDWDSNVEFPDGSDSVVIFVPVGQPLLFELASSLIGHRVDNARIDRARRSVGLD